MGSIISPTVTFGNPQPGGNICIGKGVCKVSSQDPTANAQQDPIALVNPTSAPGYTPAATKGIPVLFELSPIDKSVLIMSFRLSDLKKSQPEQVPYFESGEYAFDEHYSFHHEEFKGLHFHHNPRIERGRKNQVHIVGDLVTTFFQYAHGRQE